ncbi:MAG: hypothetical protein MdMp024_1053 [Bacteroidales bacterium]
MGCPFNGLSQGSHIPFSLRNKGGQANAVEFPFFHLWEANAIFPPVGETVSCLLKPKGSIRMRIQRKDAFMYFRCPPERIIAWKLRKVKRQAGARQAYNPFHAGNMAAD